MTATRAFARALSASLCFGVGRDELVRRKTLAEATADAEHMAHLHRMRAYVYRQNGMFKASTNEPEIMPGAELVVEIAA
jgi:hypothetical protein